MGVRLGIHPVPLARVPTRKRGKPRFTLGKLMHTEVSGQGTSAPTLSYP